MATKKKESIWPDRAYPDLHDHLKALHDAGLLVTVARPINKATEMHPLVRWQFRGGIAEPDRKAFLFTNPTDSKERRYDIPVAVGVVAANREIYRMGMGCELDEIDERWAQARDNPIEPNVVERAPCQEIVIEGDDLDKVGNGLDAIPVPISTPGWDISPFTTLSQYITKDPDTGIQNMGNYRGQVKAQRRLGMNPSLELRPGIYVHWQKYGKRGEPLPAAVVLGAPPAVTFTSAVKLPETLDELSVAGGLVGSPINVVKARTVDLMVPAEAEIVIEGYIDTEYLEPEAPFGESHGHVNLQEYNAFMEVTAITRRSDAILTSFIRQIAPSESSTIRRTGLEFNYLSHLRDHLGIKGVTRVRMHVPLTGGHKIFIVQVEKGMPNTEIWRALYGVSSLQRFAGKIVIATDQDIAPDNADAVLWALSFRAKPHLDMEILRQQDGGHGPTDTVRGDEDSALLVSAVLKEDYPPISLPKREFMERARDIWENDLKLQPLKPETPWYGYSLGAWTDELEQEAIRAVQGDHWENGRIAAQRRRNDVDMNTEVRDVPDLKDD